MCMGPSSYFSEFWGNHVTLGRQQLVLHLILGRAHSTGIGHVSSRLDLVCEAHAYGFGCIPWGGGICKALGAPGKSCLLRGLLLKVLNELVQLLKEATALAFSSLGLLAQAALAG